MKHRVAVSVFLSVACMAFVPGCNRSDSKQQQHQQSPPAPAELEPATVTIFGERVLLFLEFPPLVQGESARFLAHLSVLATGEPVRAGKVTLSIGPATFVADGPKRDGLFVPEGRVDSHGRHAATLIVASEQAEESLSLGELVVHSSGEDARLAAEAVPGPEPTGASPFLMEAQWRIQLLLAAAGPRSMARRLIVPAQVRAPEGALVVVTPPLGGRLIAPAEGALPRTGDVVEAGQHLGFVEPPLGATDVAQLQALQLEFDLKSLDIVRASSEAQARLDFAMRDHERLAKLREHGLSTAQELDLAARNLAVARSDSVGAQATRESLERLRAARLERVGEATGTLTRFALVSPLSGTVIAAGRLQGESVEPDSELFRILDTSRVWVEGRVSEFDLHLIGKSSTAVATFSALPGARFEVGGGGARFMQILPTIDAESRTAILRCELSSADGAIKPGMLAELEIATDRVDAPVVVPSDAIVMDQGMPTAYVMLEGELFQKRDLELGVKDGGFVEIHKGILAGERVATRGAYVVKLAALSPTSFGAGHQH